MKIDGMGGVSSPKNVDKKKKTSNSGAFAAHLNDVGEASSSSSVGGVSAVNSLFMLQEVDEDSYKKSAVIKEGFDAITYLDDIRMSLLDGSISYEKLKNLESMIASWRKNYGDSKLEEIINEIEIRSLVELAKIESMQ